MKIPTPDDFTQKEHQAPGRACSPLSFRPKIGALTLLAATLVVVLLTGSFAAIVLSLQHHSPANATSAHGSGIPAAATPCTQAYPVSGTITRVVFSNAMLGTATTAGTAWARGPKGQYRDLLGGDFVLHFLKETKVFEQQEQGCPSVSLTSLKVGQRIQIQFDGSILQSWIPQILAQQLMIVADGGSSS